MKPEFALSLSQEGIRLLHRVATEWQVVGEADPTSPALADALAAMKSAAADLAPNGVFCKLIVPNEQIKYLSLEAPDAGREDNLKTAAQALDGATPYSAEELVFDVCRAGDVLQIAAVARETLAEAESFAVENGFTPVSFGANPDRSAFAAEPYFGQTEKANHPLSVDATATPTAIRSTPQTDGDASDGGSDITSHRQVPTFKTSTSSVATLDAPGFAESVEKFKAADPAIERRPAAKQPTSAARPLRKSPVNKSRPAGPFATMGHTDAPRAGVPGVAIAAAVVILLGLAAFTSSALGINFFGRLANPPPAAQFTAPLQPEVPAKIAAPTVEASTVEPATLETGLTDEDVAVLDALGTPQLDAPTPRPDRTDDELRAAYAVTGIWPLAPDVPAPPALIDLDNLYEASIDPFEMNLDAVALPSLASLGRDEAFPTPATPAPAGTQFELDARGMVVPTAEGALNPDGIVVYTGAPPLRQPDNMLRIEEPGEDLATRIRLAGFRPQPRPENLVEQTEPTIVDSPSRSESGQVRPKLRPTSEQASALAAASLVPQQGGNDAALIQQPQPSDFAAPTARAIAVSLRPDPRPSDLKVVMTRTEAPAPGIDEITTVARVAPRIVAPKIPSSASVSREATVNNAINLRRVNLIGVYGKPSSRRALIRLQNGRYRKVQVGDRIDGGRVSAIGDAELRYQKSGRSIVLKMPKG